MGFVDLFRPKWKHSDAEVRAAAVRDLSSDETEVLQGIAQTDQDAGVRRIAIKKLEDPAILAQIAREDADESLRLLAGDKASSILVSRATAEGEEQDCLQAVERITEQRALAEVAKAGAHRAVRQAALQRLSDDKALAEVARNAREPQVRIEALELVNDPAVLRSVALNDERKEVCLAALAHLEDREALDAVARKAKNKTVRAQARKQLDALGGGPVSNKKIQARRQQLCETVDVLSRSSDWERSGQKIEQAQSEWESLGGEPDPELEQRFQQAVKTFFARFEEHKARQAERQERDRELQEALARGVALCEEVEALDGDGVEARVEELKQRWEQLEPLPQAHREVIEQRFRKACEQALARQEREAEQADAVERMASLCERAERLLDSPRPRQALKRFQKLRSELDGIEAAEGTAELTSRFNRVGEQLEQRIEQQQQEREQAKQDNKRRLESLCERLESAAETNKLKGAERLLKDAQSNFKRLGDLPSKEEREALTERFHAAREKLFTRVQELREADEWKRWSVVPKLEALCEKVEGLAKEENLKTVSQQLRKSQAAWKKIGPAPRDKAEALWQRFKTACDQTYERCQGYFAELEQQRDEHLKQKLALCEEAEALAAEDLGEDRARYEETANKLKEMQARWKKIGPVPKAQSDAVWARFRKACDLFFNKRQELLDQASGERDENLKQKTELCEEAEQLAATEVSDKVEWEGIADKLKGLQARWKRIGPVPRAQSDAIWARFRQACDQFFERRQRQAEQERAENQARKEGLCDRLEALVADEGADPGELATQVLAVRSEWREIGPVPQAAAPELWSRFRKSCEQAVAAHAQSFEGTELDPAANQKKLERLVQQVEELVEQHIPTEQESQPAEPAGSVEQMAEQLRDALARNALRDAATAEAPPLQETLREVKRLQGQWKKIGPVPGDAAEEQAARFCAACDRLFALRPPKQTGRGKQQQEQVDGAQEENLKLKEALCEEAEQLAAADNPAEHQESVRELRRRWKAIGPVPKSRARRLWNRFRRSCNRVMSAAKAAEAPPVTEPPVETGAVETPPVETGAVETPPVETGAVETPPVRTKEAPTPAVAGGWDASLDSGWDDVLDEEEDQRQEEG